MNVFIYLRIVENNNFALLLIYENNENHNPLSFNELPVSRDCRPGI